MTKFLPSLVVLSLLFSFSSEISLEIWENRGSVQSPLNEWDESLWKTPSAIFSKWLFGFQHHEQSFWPLSGHKSVSSISMTDVHVIWQQKKKVFHLKFDFWWLGIYQQWSTWWSITQIAVKLLECNFCLSLGCPIPGWCFAFLSLKQKPLSIRCWRWPQKARLRSMSCRSVPVFLVVPMFNPP